MDKKSGKTSCQSYHFNFLGSGKSEKKIANYQHFPGKPSFQLF